MGTFTGHLLPGLFFLTFGVWWTVSILNRFYQARFRKGPAFRATLTYPCLCCCGRLSRLPTESVLKMAVAMVGLIAEVVTAFYGGNFVYIGNGQHATMYAFFGLSGLIDILMYHGVPLPKLTDYVFFVLCFVVEGLLFMFHLHGRSHLDQSIHQLLVYVVWCCVLAFVIEMRYPLNVFCGLARCFFVMLQGTWFIQVGAILYPPFQGMMHWDGGSHENIMLATILFAWHIFFIFLFMCLTAIALAKFHGKNVEGVYNELKKSCDEHELGLIAANDFELEDIEIESS